MAAADQLIQEITNAVGSPRPRIGLDTNCVQYYLGNIQPWADCLNPIFQAGINGEVDLYVSAVVVSELLAHAHFNSRNQVGYDPELNLLAILNRHFQILDVDEDIAKAAGRLRGNHVPSDKIVLKTPDALIGATSFAHGHTVFITNDLQLANALPKSNCLYLRDWALEWLEASFPDRCLSSTVPVRPSHRGEGLGNAIPGTLELGAIRPNRTARWNRILDDAFRVAAAFTEPCMFFVLTSKNGRKMDTEEVIFWHLSLSGSRPVTRIIKRLQEHIDYSPRTGRIGRPKNSIHAFYFTSIHKERQRQRQPGFASKSDHQREADAWNNCLFSIWAFRHALSLPQVTWLLCDSATAKMMAGPAMLSFLGQACNVLGWKE